MASAGPQQSCKRRDSSVAREDDQLIITPLGAGNEVGRSCACPTKEKPYCCTIPHKEAALKCCDEVNPVAKSTGAVNCIIRRSTDGKLIGYNTDYVGAISAIEDGLKGIYHVV
ncbi:hypothetical protein I3842_08G111100 [Carya illinoinensis]|uniref:Shikimate dehydrogenase substrate binding N-terminal domain-containing protein n=1 Tax=Carya illinoinensis TaxID=32201 RepID=A0A922EDY7_CARIL|nr:hypothetical protein I3842_08G111100 [Carya illinoinensis]